MELLQLKYFMEVAKSNSITRAAEKLYVAQPTISQTIGRLEKELNVKLFDRIGKNVQLNSHGEILLKGVTDMFNCLNETMDILEIYGDTIVQPLTIEIWPRSTICSNLLEAFHQRYPYIDLNVRTYTNGEDYDLRLTVGEYDQSADYFGDIVFKEEFLLVVPENHHLAQKESIHLLEAKDENFISMSSGSPIRTLTDKLCERAGFVPNVVYENNNIDTLCRLVRLGMGVGFTGQRTGKSADFSGLKLLHIDSPISMRIVGINWHRNQELNKSAKLFVAFVKEYMKTF